MSNPLVVYETSKRITNKPLNIYIYTSKTKRKINYKTKFDFQETLKGLGIYLYNRSVNRKRKFYWSIVYNCRGLKNF